MVQSARTALHPGLWPAPNDRCKSQKERKAHAIRKHPTRAPTGAIVISASLASLLGVGYLLSAESKTGGDAEVAAAVGMGSVAAAWLVVHTVFTLRYARPYHRKWFERNRFQCKTTSSRHT